MTSTLTDYTELFNAALLAAEQKNAPHIVQVEEGLTQLAADSGVFIPIDTRASKDQLTSLDDMLPVVRDYYKVAGKLWSVPWNSSNPVMYYNKGMFKAAGLDPAKAPTTFDELIKDCEAITAKKAELKLTACVNWPMNAWFAEQWVAMQNGLLVNNDNGRKARATETLFTGPEMLSVAALYKTLADKGYYTYSGKLNDYTGEGTSFLTKKTAITLNSTAGLTLFQTFATLQGIDLGVAGLPLPSTSATNGGTVGGANLWITSGHPDTEAKAAIDFIFFLTNTENDQRWHQASGYFPNRNASIKALEDSGWFKKNPAFAIALAQLRAANGNISNTGAVIGPSTDVRTALSKGFQSIVSGEDPQKSMQAAKNAADKALAEYNSVSP